MSGSRERVYIQLPEFPENSIMGLSKSARNHLVRYSGVMGNCGRGFIPFVDELVDVHGDDAKELIEVLRLEGKSGASLNIGDYYAVENPDSKSPTGYDWYLVRIHNHFSDFRKIF